MTTLAPPPPARAAAPRVAAAPPVPAAAGRPAGGIASEIAQSALVLAGAAGFARVFTGSVWVAPVLLTAAVALACPALTRRLLPHRAVPAAAIDVLASALVVIWTVVPASTRWGLPLRHTWRALHAALAAVGPQFASSVPPASPTTGFVLLAAGGVGASALVATWVAHRLRRPGWALVAPVAVFAATCVLGEPKGAILATFVEALLVGANVAATRPAHPGGHRSLLRAQGRLLAVAAVGAALVTASIAGPDGNGAAGWRAGGTTTRVIVSPMVSLSTRLAPRDAGVPVFQVRSPVRSYWQLTTLDVFSGDTWEAGRASYRSFGDRLPAAPVPAPKGTREVRERFRVQTLDSPWLPAAFTPVAVSGASDVQYNPGTGSLLTKHRTADGMQYTVTSLQYVDTLSRAKLASAPALSPRDVPAGSLSLPPGLPGDVTDLAQRIVAGKRTELAKALALQDFFYGPQFSYSLDPPADGSGLGAVTTFLFETRTGYCQQFAGAFAILARAAGLPTRLAVGFTTGTQVGPHTYQVTDADAHTWPQVWFPTYGWVPFEPTKGSPGSGFAIPGTTQYTGRTQDVGTPAPSSSPRSNAPTTTVPTAPVSGGTGAPASGGPGRSITRPGARLLPSDAAGAASAPAAAPAPTLPAPATGTVPAAVAGWVAAALAGLAALAAAAAAVLRWRRHRRRRRAIAAGGAVAVLAAWDEMAEALTLAGLPADPAETRTELAARAAGWLGWRVHGLNALARAADAAAWAGSPPAETSPELLDTARQVTLAARHRAPFARRLRALLDLRWAWRPAAGVG